MIVLGIETSCDETGVAICHNSQVIESHTKTQLIHNQYGGVVPELASREHEKYLSEITDLVLSRSSLELKDIDAIAVTNGPGLMGSLLSGVSFAKGLAQGLGIPIVPVNHLEAHLNSIFIDHPSLKIPHINFLISGGHTQLWLVKKLFDYELIGQTLDDACGEAFDKGAKLLGLPYPGGPEIDKISKQGNPLEINFPRPMIQSDTFDLSFSGLKTSLLNYIRKNRNYDLNDVCSSYQEAIIDSLISKFDKALNYYEINTGVLCGGVAANSRLRQKLESSSKNFYFPSMKYCTDNADMIAFLGELKYKNSKKRKNNYDINVFSKM